MFSLSVFFVFIVLGTLTAIIHVPFAMASPVPELLVNSAIGALSGAALAGAAIQISGAVKQALEREKAEVRLVNSLTMGVASIAIALVLHFSIALIFATGVGVRIAQGIVLPFCALIGLYAGYSLEQPLFASTGPLPIGRRAHRKAATQAKVLDTSVIIDGRIADLLATGFLEGEILVPEFVLSELQNIADSSNNLRRRKGRRGLEVLNALMDDECVNMRVCTQDYVSLKDVDTKLIHLARDKAGALVTTDYNLNRVAQVEGVKILNVNELANAVKPRFIPGEEIAVEVIDRGEEIGQGVGYLDDGTMVVVENGRRHIGRTIKAVVKSTLQTEAGRMLFVEPTGESSRWEK